MFNPLIPLQVVSVSDPLIPLRVVSVSDPLIPPWVASAYDPLLPPRVVSVSGPLILPRVVSVSGPLIPPWVVSVSDPLIPPRVVSVYYQPLSAIVGHRTPRLFLPLAPTSMSHLTRLPPGRSVCHGYFYTGTQRSRRCPNQTLVLQVLLRLCRHRQLSVVLILPPADSLCYCLRWRIADSETAVLLLRLSEEFWKMTNPTGFRRRLAARLPVVVVVWRIVSLVR